MEKFINQEEAGLKKFVFEIYDTMDNNLITDQSLFWFMSVMTRNLPEAVQSTTDLLPLGHTEKDMFLELFSADFCKIQNTLKAKAAAGAPTKKLKNK